MKNRLFMIFALIVLFSCSKEKEDNEIKEGKGTVWLSGGLMFCATQIRMENGDTLIPVIDLHDTIFFPSTDQKIKIKYVELQNRESGCSIGKDCKIIELTTVE